MVACVVAIVVADNLRYSRLTFSLWSPSWSPFCLCGRHRGRQQLKVLAVDPLVVVAIVVAGEVAILFSYPSYRRYVFLGVRRQVG